MSLPPESCSVEKEKTFLGLRSANTTLYQNLIKFNGQRYREQLRHLNLTSGKLKIFPRPFRTESSIGKSSAASKIFEKINSALSKIRLSYRFANMVGSCSELFLFGKSIRHTERRERTGSPKYVG